MLCVELYQMFRSRCNLACHASAERCADASSCASVWRRFGFRSLRRVIELENPCFPFGMDQVYRVLLFRLWLLRKRLRRTLILVG